MALKLTSAATTGEETGRRRAILPVLIGVAALVAVVSSLGAPLIPSIAESDHVSLSAAEWVLTAALMMGALVTPAMGRLADGPRKRVVIEVALASVLVGCVLSAVSTTFLVLVIGRGFQGIGLGLLPVTMAIARAEFPPDKAGRAIANLSVSAAVGAGLGYPITSTIAQFFDFRGGLLVWCHHRRDRAHRRHRCHPSSFCGSHSIVRLCGHDRARPGGDRGVGGAERGG